MNGEFREAYHKKCIVRRASNDCEFQKRFCSVRIVHNAMDIYFRNLVRRDIERGRERKHLPIVNIHRTERISVNMRKQKNKTGFSIDLNYTYINDYAALS